MSSMKLYIYLFFNSKTAAKLLLEILKLIKYIYLKLNEILAL